MVIISHCVSMLCDHCICNYISYLFLCVFCSANCKDASGENSINGFMPDISLRRSSLAIMNISLSMWCAMIAFFLSYNIGKCIISGWRCYSISTLKCVLFLALLLLCHVYIESNPAPKKSSNCQPLKFVNGTSIAYYQKIVLKYLS